MPDCQGKQNEYETALVKQLKTLLEMVRNLQK